MGRLEMQYLIPQLRCRQPRSFSAGDRARDINQHPLAVLAQAGFQSLFQLTALGGADNIVVNDLTKTDVTQVDIDLAGVPGSGVGDGQPDTVTVNATSRNDLISSPTATSPGSSSADLPSR